jgi:hypothetical protein
MVNPSVLIALQRQLQLRRNLRAGLVGRQAWPASLGRAASDCRLPAPTAIISRATAKRGWRAGSGQFRHDPGKIAGGQKTRLNHFGRNGQRMPSATLLLSPL